MRTYIFVSDIQHLLIRNVVFPEIAVVDECIGDNQLDIGIEGPGSAWTIHPYATMSRKNSCAFRSTSSWLSIHVVDSNCSLKCLPAGISLSLSGILSVGSWCYCFHDRESEGAATGLSKTAPRRNDGEALVRLVSVGRMTHRNQTVSESAENHLQQCHVRVCGKRR